MKILEKYLPRNLLKANFLANIEFCLKSKHQKKEDQKDRKKEEFQGAETKVV